MSHGHLYVCVYCDDTVRCLYSVLPGKCTKCLKSAMHLTTQIAQQTGPDNEHDHLVTDHNTLKLAMQF